MISVRSLGFSCFNIFVTSVYTAEKGGLCAHFETVFLLNEFYFALVSGGWVGWLIFGGLFADMN